MKNIHLILSTIIFTTLATQANLSIAESTNLGAHVHGLSTLTIAMENNTLQIELDSPAMNLLGFEHEANSKEDKETLKQTMVKLQDPTSLFSFIGTECKPVDININNNRHINQSHHTHHDEHDHDDHHMHNEHIEHAHNDITSSYVFSCSDSALTSVSVKLFEYFPGIQKMNTMWVINSKQGAITLTPSNPTISFR